MHIVRFICFSVIVAYCQASLYNDYQQAQFIKGWAAHCADKFLPDYDAREISPEIRKCDTERCVFYMYKYISDNRPEFFRDFDICFESNTARRSKSNGSQHLNQHY